ncbi:MAG: tRNA pseudouridine(13) synthase TruD [Planctomycetes bacterium]|jgi:tRNA pseudouridine13 synthase|nr:tRNA pseudouridine(13) synthase TruD [Planctomycetota bacterium]
MKIKQLPEDFQVKEIAEIPFVEGGRYAVYLLRKRSANTLDAVADVARACGVPRAAVAFAGLKDKHAVAWQHVSVAGGPAGPLRGPAFEARFLGRSDRPVGPDLLRGNEFRVVVRGLTRAQAAHLDAALRAAAESGVPNYFDDQRFGSARHGQGFVAERMARGDPEGALRLFAATPARKDTSSRKAAAAEIARRWGDWAGLARDLRPGTERRIAAHLAANPGDFAGAIERIEPQLLSILLHAWQSWLWNRAAVAFLREEPGALGRFERPTPYGPLAFYESLEPGALERLRGLEIPLFPADPAAEPEAVASALRRVAAEEGLEGGEFRLRGTKAFFKRGRRPLLAFPEGLHAGNPQPDELDPGRRKVLFAMSLPAGSYATIVVKRATVWAAGKRKDEGAGTGAGGRGP